MRKGVFAVAGAVAGVLLGAGTAHPVPPWDAQLTLEDKVVVVGVQFHVKLTVTNTSGDNLEFGSSGDNSLTGAPSTMGTLTEFEGLCCTSQILAPGAMRTFTGSGVANSSGTWVLTGWVSGKDNLGNPIQPGASTTVNVLSGSQAEALHPVKAGSIEIRRNFIRVRMRTGAEQGLVVVRGPANGVVTLHVAGPSGLRLGYLSIDRPGGITDLSDGQVRIGADGVATAPLNPVLYGGAKLKTGPFWLVASGAVNDRKPFLVLDETD